MDKRQHPRYHLNYFMAVHEVSSDALIGYVIDISESGMRVTSESKTITVGDTLEAGIEVKLETGETERFFLTAQVLWVRLDTDPNFCQIGFRFIEIPTASMHIIRFVIDGNYNETHKTVSH